VQPSDTDEFTDEEPEAIKDSIIDSDLQLHINAKEPKHSPTVRRKAKAIADWRAPDTSKALLGIAGSPMIQMVKSKASLHEIQMPKSKAPDSVPSVMCIISALGASGSSVESSTNSDVALIEKSTEVKLASKTILSDQVAMKRKRGRPLGSKNKLKLASDIILSSDEAIMKRKRGVLQIL